MCQIYSCLPKSLVKDLQLNKEARINYMRRALKIVFPRLAEVFDTEAHIETLKPEQLPGIHEFYKMMYAYLGIIDNKTGSLLRFNALILSAVGISSALLKSDIVQSTARVTYNYSAVLTPVVISVILSAISLIILLTCIYNKWDTFSYENGAYIERMDYLLRIRNSRTIRYRIAWVLNFGSVLFLYGAVILWIVLAELMV